MDLEFCTAGAPADCDEQVIFAQIQGLDNLLVRMINHAIFYDKVPMSPGNLKKQRLRLRREEAAYRQEEHSEEDEDPERSQEVEPSNEGTNADSDDEAAKDQDTAGSTSPSEQASSEKADSQDE